MPGNTIICQMFPAGGWCGGVFPVKNMLGMVVTVKKTSKCTQKTNVFGLSWKRKINHRKNHTKNAGLMSKKIRKRTKK